MSFVVVSFLIGSEDPSENSIRVPLTVESNRKSCTLRRVARDAMRRFVTMRKRNRIEEKAHLTELFNRVPTSQIATTEMFVGVQDKMLAEVFPQDLVTDVMKIDQEVLFLRLVVLPSSDDSMEGAVGEESHSAEVEPTKTRKLEEDVDRHSSCDRSLSPQRITNSSPLFTPTDPSSGTPLAEPATVARTFHSDISPVTSSPHKGRHSLHNTPLPMSLSKCPKPKYGGNSPIASQRRLAFDTPEKVATETTQHTAPLEPTVEAK
ncbi:hypothetical protein AGDE_15408 [Angomonas deanei]|nr:hypothetical protein AGDE_15408 [Angomonas deanei]|eukprot:EPY19137.1 hypothetical protein AGDE_15408 [Angomonas deanei]